MPPNNKSLTHFKNNLKKFHKNLYSNIEDFKNRFEEIDLKYNQALIENADDICDGKYYLWDSIYIWKKYEWAYDPISKNNWPLNIFYNKINTEYPELGDLKYVLEINKLNSLVILSQAYVISRDTKYILEVENIVRTWIDKNPVNFGVTWKIELDIALRNINLIFCSLCLINNSYFCENIYQLISGLIKINLKKLRKYPSYKWFKSQPGGNHTIGELIGIIISSVLYDKNLSNHRLLKYFSLLEKALEDSINKDGVYLEQSANYSKFVAELLITLDIVIRNTGNEDLYVKYYSSYLEKLSGYLYDIQNNLTLPNFGDCDGSKGIPFFSTSNNLNINSILYYTHKVFNYKNIAFDESSLDGMLKWCAKKELFNKEKKNCPDNMFPRIFDSKSSGQFSFRYKNYDEYIYLFLRNGRHAYGRAGRNVHSHNDQLAVIISISSANIFIDRGVYLYNSGIKYRNEDRSTRNHNTIYLENTEQAEMLDKWSYLNYPKISNYDFSLDNNVLNYSGECIYSDISHLREVIVKYKELKVLIVDKINFSGNRKGEINFLLDESIKPYSLDNENILLSNLSNKFLLNIKGCDSLFINETYYYPNYGIQKKTFSIKGKFEAEASKHIESSISIYNK